MKKYLTPSVLAPVAGLSLAMFLFSSEVVLAANDRLIDVEDNPDTIEGSSEAWGGSLRQAFLTIINFFLYFLGLVATLFVIYGGFLYITAGGDDGKVENAKKILMYAVIGIIICLMSFAIINTVIDLGEGNRDET